MSVVFYVSGHGFGHASRDIEVINALGSRRPDVAIMVRTAAPRWLFDLTLTCPVTFKAVECDTGVVQIDSLELDAAETIRRAAAFHHALHTRAAIEAIELKEAGASLVVGDIPPLAFAAAALAGVPAVALGNFTWDWIYAGYREAATIAPELVPAIEHAYRQAAMAWRLPMSGGFDTIHAVVDVPFIARHSRRPQSEVRAAIGLPGDRPLVLLSFGGHGLDRLERNPPASSRYSIVTTAAPSGAGGNGVHRVDEQKLYGEGLRYEDLVSAADVVVTKPGYGIIAECIANDTAMLYTSRGHFVEYEVLVREMPRYLRCAYIEQEDLFAGRWEPYLDRVLSSPPPRERPTTNGADVVADLIVQTLAV